MLLDKVISETENRNFQTKGYMLIERLPNDPQLTDKDVPWDYFLHANDEKACREVTESAADKHKVAREIIFRIYIEVDGKRCKGNWQDRKIERETIVESFVNDLSPEIAKRCMEFLEYKLNLLIYMFGYKKKSAAIKNFDFVEKQTYFSLQKHFTEV